MTWSFPRVVLIGFYRFISSSSCWLISSRDLALRHRRASSSFISLRSSSTSFNEFLRFLFLDGQFCVGFDLEDFYWSCLVTIVVDLVSQCLNILVHLLYLFGLCRFVIQLSVLDDLSMYECIFFGFFVSWDCCRCTGRSLHLWSWLLLMLSVCYWGHLVRL